MAETDRAEGRRAFGADPEGYDRARPDYPPEVYELLRGRCGLRLGTRIFEVGAGTGKATRHLLCLGASPLVAVEPDERLVAYLCATLPTEAGCVEVAHAAFEDAPLAAGWFDLGVAATSFHWLDQGAALGKVASLLRPGGWWAAWWNVFGDPSRPDEFHEATQGLLGGLDRTPYLGRAGHLPFALDQDARLADLRVVGAFEDVACEMIRWTVALDPAGVRGLYATFSPVSRLPAEEQARLLEALAGVAEDRFGGRVERPIVTPIYTARRR
jgi:SAM-dependent methyltransferase